MKVRPLFDNILIEPIEKEERTPAGIVIPDTAKEKPQEGRVVAVGPGRQDENGKRIPIEVRVGSKVLYKKWGGNEIKIEGKDYLIVKGEDVLATID